MPLMLEDRSQFLVILHHARAGFSCPQVGQRLGQPDLQHLRMDRDARARTILAVPFPARIWRPGAGRGNQMAIAAIDDPEQEQSADILEKPPEP